MRDAILSAVKWLDDFGVEIPTLVLVDACKYFKTEDYFQRVLYGYLVDLYRGDISESDFVDGLADLLERQLRRAFNEGMRANGLDPLQDMVETWEQKFQDIVSNEFAFVDGFASDIASGNYTLAQLQSRAQTWVSRYKDVVNQATLITADGKDRLEWKLGKTEKHCETCAKLDGVVAFASEWEISGIRPQNPPNNNLECGGWKCDCSLEPTEKRRSPKAIDILLNVGVEM